MKKKWIFSALVVLCTLIFTTATVLASAPASIGAEVKKTPSNPVQLTRQAGGSPSDHAADNKKDHDKKVKMENFKGVVASVAADSIIVTLDDGTLMTFGVSADTSIKIPTLGRTATIANLLAGQKVTVRAFQPVVDNGNGNAPAAADPALEETVPGWVAKTIQVYPGKPVRIHRVGIVTDYQPGISITIDDGTGTLYTFVVTAETKILPEERLPELTTGSLVTIICPRDVTGGLPTAKGIVVHPAGTELGDVENVEETEEVETPDSEETELPEVESTPLPTEPAVVP